MMHDGKSMRYMRSLALIATIPVLVTLFVLGCKSAPDGVTQGMAIDQAVIADVTGNCDGAASTDELGQLESYFSQHSTGWYAGAFPLTWEERDSNEVSTEVLREFFGRYQLYGPYESETELRNTYKGVGINTPHVGIYVIEKDAGYTITHLYRAGGDGVHDGAWKEIVISSSGTSYEALSVSLGEEFVLHARQCAAIEGEDLVVEVTEFYNSPFPDGMQCFWSGVGIRFEYRHAGEEMTVLVQNDGDFVQAFGYQTTILDTDHETFARLTITRLSYLSTM